MGHELPLGFRPLEAPGRQALVEVIDQTFQKTEFRQKGGLMALGCLGCLGHAFIQMGDVGQNELGLNGLEVTYGIHHL